MPVDNSVFDEHKDILSLYWTTQDVLSFLADTSDDPHLVKIKELQERHVTGTSASKYDDASVASIQHRKSAQRIQPIFESLRTTANGHKIQDVRELMPIPVIITSDITKSPPVLVVYACQCSLDVRSKHLRVH